jgi:SAM-dependent methyltransferase
MTDNKKHWYDGWFYDKIIAPNQDKLFRQVKDLIGADSDVIDVGCVTGRLEFTLSDRCKSVLGIDLSKKNIDRANLLLDKNPDAKISFRHNNIHELVSNSGYHFDYAILTYVIHEVNKEEGVELLKEISLIADRILIGDYVVPGSKGFGTLLSEVIEFIAGREHYRNYKSYVADGGIKYLAERAGLRIIDEIENHHLSNHIVVLTR